MRAGSWRTAHTPLGCGSECDGLAAKHRHTHLSSWAVDELALKAEQSCTQHERGGDMSSSKQQQQQQQAHNERAIRRGRGKAGRQGIPPRAIFHRPLTSAAATLAPAS